MTDPNLVRRLTTILAIEALRDMDVAPKIVETPLETFQGVTPARGILIVPVLRAGLGMVDPILELVPSAKVGHVGIERDHETALPRSYYSKIPPPAGMRILVVDPMLATGGTGLHAIRSIQELGGTDITVLSIVAAPEGVAVIEQAAPSVKIVTAALDRCLNDKKYILPGVGDFGDRLMGTI